MVIGDTLWSGASASHPHTELIVLLEEQLSLGIGAHEVGEGLRAAAILCGLWTGEGVLGLPYAFHVARSTAALYGSQHGDQVGPLGATLHNEQLGMAGEEELDEVCEHRRAKVVCEGDAAASSAAGRGH